MFITFDDSWQKMVTNKLQNAKEDDDEIGAHLRLPRETNWLQAALWVRQPTRSLNHGSLFLFLLITEREMRSFIYCDEMLAPQQGSACEYVFF